MIFFYFFNIGFTPLKIITPWSALVLLNSIIYFRNHKKATLTAAFKADDKNHRFLKTFFIIGIAFEAAYAFFRALIKPLESYDAIAIYAIKAKIFYLSKSIPHDFFSRVTFVFPHPDYPLNIPLSETLIYLFLGNLNDQLVKIIFPLYFVSILTVVYFGIRRFANSSYALLFTFLLASVPQFSAYATNGYLDLPLSFYCLTSALFLFLWFQNREAVCFLMISAVMAGLAGWTKNEGFMYCAINIFMVVLFFIFDCREKIWSKLWYLFTYAFIIFAISLPWIIIKKSAGLVNDEISLINYSPANLISQSYKIVPIIYEFQKQAFGFKKWNLLWIVLFFILIVKRRFIFIARERYVTIFLFLSVSGYILMYLINSSPIEWSLGRTWSRFLLHFLPLAVFWMATILKEDPRL